MLFTRHFDEVETIDSVNAPDGSPFLSVDRGEDMGKPMLVTPEVSPDVVDYNWVCPDVLDSRSSYRNAKDLRYHWFCCYCLGGQVAS